MTPASLFTVGARVAIDNGFGVREDFVAKVYKSGNFTLVSDKGARPNQWRPWGDRYANQTGDNGRWSRTTLRLWDTETDAELTAERDKSVRQRRLRDLCERLRRLGPNDVTEAALSTIEAALSKPEDT